MSPASRKVAHAALMAAILFLCIHRLVLGFAREFDPDELQHMHGGFSVAAGLVPYVDYFEHHAPWSSWLAAALVRIMGPDWNTLMAARLLAFFASTLSLLATYALVSKSTARPELGPDPERDSAAVTLGLVGVLAQITILTWIHKAVEIRPDVPASLSFGVALVWLLDGLRGGGGKPLRAASLGGLSLGAGFMFTPKLAFAALGTGAGVLLWMLAVGARRESGVRGSARVLGTFTAMSFVPAALTAAVLLFQGHFQDFLRDVVIGPLHWERELGPKVHLRILVDRNPLHVTVGVAGLAWALWSGLRRRAVDPAAIVVPCAALGVVVGWFLVPVPWPQFLLPLMPLLAFGVALMVDRCGRSGWPGTFLLGATVIALIGLFMTWLELSGRALARHLEPAAWIAAGGLAALWAMPRPAWRTPGVLVAVGAVASGAVLVQPHALPFGAPWLLLGAVVAFTPAPRLFGSLVIVAVVAGPLLLIGRIVEERPMGPFRAEYDAIMANTDPGDTVLTGWRGAAVFRPHAYRYFFLHEGMRTMLDEGALGPDVVAAMEARRPAAVIRDEAVRALGPEVQAYLDAQFAPSGIGDVWFRRP